LYQLSLRFGAFSISKFVPFVKALFKISFFLHVKKSRLQAALFQESFRKGIDYEASSSSSLLPYPILKKLSSVMTDIFRANKRFEPISFISF
jgi:hypothetical protein